MPPLPPIKPKEIGYFDPSLDKPPVGSDDVTVFGDINPFCEQLRRGAWRYNVQVMIAECFRCAANPWWMPLPDALKDKLKDYTVEQWITELKRRFSVKPDTAWSKLYQ